MEHLQIITTLKMNKGNIVLYVILFFLTVAFLLVSLLVRLRKNNPVLISRKIKLGATIITLTTILSACVGTPQIEQETCYKEASGDTVQNMNKNDTVAFKDTLNNEEKIKKGKINNKGILSNDTVITVPSIPHATCYIAVMNDDTIK